VKQPNPYEPPLPTGEEPELRPRVVRIIRTLLFFTIGGGVAGLAFGFGSLLSDHFGLVIRGRSLQNSIEAAKGTALGGAIGGALLGSLFALIVWFDHPHPKDQPLFPFLSKKRRGREAREALEKP